MLSQNIDDNNFIVNRQCISQFKVSIEGSQNCASTAYPRKSGLPLTPKLLMCPVGVHTLCDHASAGKLRARQQLVGECEHRAIEGEPARKGTGTLSLSSHCNKQSMCWKLQP